MNYNSESYRSHNWQTIIRDLERTIDGGSRQYETTQAPLPAAPIPTDATDEEARHGMMIPYYRDYIYGDPRLCKPNMETIRWKMKSIIEGDPLFGQWASEQDLITAAERWGDNMKRIDETHRIYQFFHILEALLESDCHQDWCSLAEELKIKLFKSEVYSDYKTDEVLCVLHGFTMIMQQNWSKEKKKETLELLRSQWLFMKHYYSVMTRHIVGVKWTKFADVAKTVMRSSQSFLPHMHIFYCGLIDCVDELWLDKKQQRQMDKVVQQMQDRLGQTEPSEMLYELCDTLFPEDFQRLLREHRPKGYNEIEDENRKKDELIKEMNIRQRRLQKELDKTRDLLQQMIVSSIPIERIDEELMKYNPATAWDLLCKLSECVVLHGIEVWQNAYPKLLVKYRERLNESVRQQQMALQKIQECAERPSATYNYAPGATHHDCRNQIITNDTPNLLANE